MFVSEMYSTNQPTYPTDRALTNQRKISDTTVTYMFPTELLQSLRTEPTTADILVVILQVIP